MKKINIAIAGFRHGHIYSLLDCAKNSENFNILGGWEEYDPDKEIAKSKGVEFTYNSYEEILNDENVDAVAIANYYQARGQMVIDALKAGKHVISDKPFCTSEEEMEEIIDLVKKTGLQMFAMLDLRFNSNIQAAKKLIDDGVIGEINSISFNGQHPLQYGTRPCWYFEEGKHGGTINDIAIHGIDLIRYFTGSELKEINAARTWNKFAKEVPFFNDSAMLMITMENGVGVMADVSYAVPSHIKYSLPFYWEFRIWGTEGVINFSCMTDGITLFKDGNDGPVVYPGIIPEVTYMDCFAEAINGNESDYLSTDSSIKSAKATLSIQKFADNKQPQ